MSAAEYVTFAHWKRLDCWSCCFFLQMLDIQQQKRLQSAYLYIYIHMCVCVYFTCLHMYSYSYILIHTKYTFLCISILTCVFKCCHIFRHIYSIHIFTCLYILTYTLTYSYICILMFSNISICLSMSSSMHCELKTSLDNSNKFCCLPPTKSTLFLEQICSPSRCSMPSTTSNKCSSGARIKASKESMSKTKSQSKTSGKEFKYFPGNSTLNLGILPSTFFRGFSKKICWVLWGKNLGSLGWNLGSLGWNFYI